jgi:hypothetical protein
MQRWESTPPPDCPFEPSDLLTGMTFTGRYANYTFADTWYPAWASDDILYSPLDGWRFSSLARFAARCSHG